MARAYRGPYARPSTTRVKYAGAMVWGTGIDPIHSYYGAGPPLRVTGRAGHQGASPVGREHPRDREYQNAADSWTEDIPPETYWGYPGGVDYSPDSFGAGADAPISDGDTAPPVYQYMDSRPAWDEPPESQDIRRETPETQTSWGQSGEQQRATTNGSHRYRLFRAWTNNPSNPAYYQPIAAEQPNALPTETVNEGWINKTTSFVADANPADDAQVFVQTSMRQRYLSKDNTRSVMRCTDDERTPIESRVAAMVEKVYSTGERLYDMFPYQIDQRNREFRFRTAGTGPAEWLEANEFKSVIPVRRTPPPDPNMGVSDIGYPDYGYTGEDAMYYG